MINDDKILSLYKQFDGLLTGHFLLSSGMHSDMYLQTEKIMMNPAVATEVVAGLVSKLKGIEFDTVVSPAIGGIRFGYELARQLNKKTIFTERVDNIMTLRRGFTISKGEKILVVEDVVTTGKSTKECMDVVVQHGGDIVAVASLIDRSNGTSGFNVPFVPLLTLNVQTWGADNCQLCKSGSTPIKPGSRKF